MGLVSKKAATTKAIFAHLCDQMDKLNARVIDVDEAMAQANLAKQANNILKYELDRAKVIARFGDDLKIRDIEGE